MTPLNSGERFRAILALLYNYLLLNPIALRTAKTLWSFDCSKCNRVKHRCKDTDTGTRSWILKKEAHQFTFKIDIIFGKSSVWADTLSDIIVIVGHHDLYFMVQLL